MCELEAGVKTERVDDDEKAQTPRASGTHHSVELGRQLFHNHAESLQLVKHAGDVVTREAADRHQIWMKERRVQVKDFLFFTAEQGNRDGSLLEVSPLLPV